MEIRRVSYSNFEDTKRFCNDNQIKCFKEFLDKGYKGYFAYIDNLCVGRLWLFTNSDRTYLNDFVLYKLRKNELYEAWVETDENYRGRGVYLALSTYALHENREYNVLATVKPDNRVSTAAHIKSGYHIYTKYLLIKFKKIKISIGYRYSGIFRLRIKIGDYV
ncbi:MAG TPA: hypothetical protein PLY32_03935 [Salinivirgaceae bacterium]|nr:hypothetical protein [Salinivirgaceae bacterium]HQA76251.1 hypothetical protein [Salinivirgaceae bacterium]